MDSGGRPATRRTTRRSSGFRSTSSEKSDSAPGHTFAASPSQVVLAENWFEELTRLVPVP